MGWRFAAAATGALVLAVLNFANLLGSAYTSLAERRLSTAPAAPGTVAAARIGALLPAWSVSRRALHGWVLAESGGLGAVAEYHTALRWAPGDPLLWSEYALALARIDQFDTGLTLAIKQAQRLAPTSSAIQHALAELGLSYWSRGTPEQRSVWLSGMRYALDHNRGTFLTQAVTRGQALTFCRDAARRLGEERWCETMAPALLSGCFAVSPLGPTPCAPDS